MKFYISIPLLCLFNIFFLNSGLHGQETEKHSFNFNEIDSIVEHIKTKWNAPGIAIGIVKDGEIIYKKGYGYKNIEKKESVTSKTLFPVASTTKSFTATGIGLLVDNEKIDWTTPVTNYLPEFKLQDTIANNYSNLIDILCHRTGLPGHEIMQIAIAKQYDRREIVKRMKYLSFSEEFRTQWQYQNQMYQVATVLTEDISGVTWEDYIRKEILEPLQMNSTVFAGPELLENKSNLSTRYAFNNQGDIVLAEPISSFMQEVSGAGSIYSNIDDLCNWLLFNLNTGEFEGKRVVSEETMNFIRNPQIIISSFLLPQILMHSYAPGWDVMTYKGHLLYNRPGGYIGITSQLAYLPTDNMGIVILSNLQSTTAQMIISFEIIDKLLFLEETPWFEMLWPYEEYSQQQSINSLNPAVKEGDILEPTKPLEEFAGIYTNDGYGTITIHYSNNKLIADYINQSELHHYNEDEFEGYQLYKHYRFEFIKDSNNLISGLKCNFEPKISPIEFIKQ